MVRRIKYRNTGKHQTFPVKEIKEIKKIMEYLLNEKENAAKLNKLTRLYQADRNWMLVLLGFNTAFRAEDLLQLQVIDVFKGYVSIKENKTGKTQNFRMKKELHEDILAYVKRNGLNQHDYLFKSQRKDGEIRAISRQQADRIMQKVRKECNIDYTFAMHSLRKTFGYQYYANQKGDLLTLQRMYNHSDVSTTLIYIMWNTNDVEKARKDIYIGNYHK